MFEGFVPTCDGTRRSASDTHSKLMERAITSNDRKNDVPNLLAMKHASLGRMFATTKALHDKGELLPVPLPAHVSPPAVEPLRVTTTK